MASCQELLQKKLWNLSTFPTARLTSHHHHRVALQGFQDAMSILEDRKLLSFGLEEMRLLK